MPAVGLLLAVELLNRALKRHRAETPDETSAGAVGARMHGPAGAAEVVEAFLAMLFSGGERHVRRIWLISDFEAAGDAPPICAG